MTAADKRRVPEPHEGTPEMQDHTPAFSSVDWWDRRFRIEAEVVEALKVIVSGSSVNKS